MSGEDGVSVRRAALPASSPTRGHGMASPLGRESQQDRSWISMFSMRPALSFLQKYIPGMPRSPALPGGTGWASSEDFRHNLVDDQRAFLGQLGELMPGGGQQKSSSAPHLAATYLRCEHSSGPAGLIQTAGGETATLSWISAGSLQELGIHTTTAAEMEMDIRQHTHTGYLDLAATARSVLSHVFLSSPLTSSTQDLTHTEGAGQVLGGRNWYYTDDAGTPLKNAGSTRNWWGGFWGHEESPQSLMSNLSWGKGVPLTSKHCSQQEGGTKAAVAKPTELSAQLTDRRSMPGESAGQNGDKGQPLDNDCLQTSPPDSLQSSERLTLQQHQPKTNVTGVLDTEAAACSEGALPTPDQDNGYSSLEEEHIICQLYMVKAPCEEEPQQATDRTVTDTETEDGSSEAKAEAGSPSSRDMEEEEGEEEDGEEEDDYDISESDDNEGETTIEEAPSAAAAMPLTPPSCQNKSIAYIMGSPCSDDEDDNPSDSEFDSDDDDGFDSEGSSELSDPDDDNEEGDEDSDGENTSEATRLWNSLCQSRDPYNPRNFTAHITTPRSIPNPAAAAATTSSAASPCSPQSSPGSPPYHNPSPVSTSPASPPKSGDNDSWDDSTSASEVDEAESLRLWNSFTSVSDPYSPFSFQAPLRTREPCKAAAGVPVAGGQGKKVSRTLPRSPRHAAPSSSSSVVKVLQYQKEDAEERLDSGFSEPVVSAVAAPTTATPCIGTIKKVRFSEDIEEFFASCSEEEDRRGPWEELARDRCRFVRRCQEVEQSIAYCLEAQHRSLVYHRFTICYTQDT